MDGMKAQADERGYRLCAKGGVYCIVLRPLLRAHKASSHLLDALYTSERPFLVLLDASSGYRDTFLDVAKKRRRVRQIAKVGVLTESVAPFLRP